jgi:hypothetical protein
MLMRKHTQLSDQRQYNFIKNQGFYSRLTNKEKKYSQIDLIQQTGMAAWKKVIS